MEYVFEGQGQSDEFKRWIEYELSGYPDKESLPDYRVLNVNSKGHFNGAYGSGLRDADIPLSCVPEKLREMLSHCYVMQPVAAMESLVRSQPSGTLKEAWNPDIVVHIGQDIYQHMNCMQAWKVIPSGAMVAALDAVRTRVLNFVLEIEIENSSAGEAAQKSNPVPMDKVHQIFNTYINGTVQNLAPGSSNIQQTAKYIERKDTEILASLLEAVKGAVLPLKAAETVLDALVEMQATHGTSSFKKHYQTFISVLADHMQVLGPAVAPFLPALSAMVP